MGRLRPRSASGRLQAKLERLCVSVILVTHPKSYNYREDGSPRFRRQTVKVEMIPEFCSVGEARSKNSILRVFRIPSTICAQPIGNSFTPNQWHRWKAEPLKVCLMLVCDQAFGRYMSLKGAEKWSREHLEN